MEFNVSDVIERCSGILFKFLLSCLSSRCLQNNGHRYDAANNADPGDVPLVMRDILNGLT